MTELWDLVAAVFLLLGAFFCLAAAVGVLRFPDVLARLHAATKPQVFGLLLVLTAVALTHRTLPVTLFCFAVMLLQVLTNPVSGHMLARTAYRTGQWNEDEAVVDELAEDLAEAGFRDAEALPPDVGPTEAGPPGGGRG